MRNQLISLRVSTIAAYPISLDSLASGMPIPIPFPLVVKPSYGTGSKNVAVCKDTGDLYKSLARIESTDSSYLDKERLAHVEEFIDGAEYFIVTLNSGPSSARQMLCVGSYEKVKNFAETYVYRTIKSVSTSCAIAVKAFAHASEVNAAIGMDVGINDIEFKVGEKGLHIIEQNGRLPGANVPALIELCTGHNCYRLNLDVYLGRGRAVGGPLSYIKHFSICCMIAEERGTLASVKGLSFVMKLQSYHSHSLLVQPGDEVNLTEDFLSAWGFVYLVHPDPQVLAQESELVHKYLVLCMS
jgi:biotin carboxylase